MQDHGVLVTYRWLAADPLLKGCAMFTHREIFDAQHQFIEHQCGKKAAQKANYGWFMDADTVYTKVYGFGIIATDYDDNLTIWIAGAAHV